MTNPLNNSNSCSAYLSWRRIPNNVLRNPAIIQTYRNYSTFRSKPPRFSSIFPSVHAASDAVHGTKLPSEGTLPLPGTKLHSEGALPGTKLPSQRTVHVDSTAQNTVERTISAGPSRLTVSEAEINAYINSETPATRIRNMFSKTYVDIYSFVYLSMQLMNI